jgi:hypothetical protein
MRNESEDAGSDLIGVAVAVAEWPMTIRTLHDLSKLKLEAKLDITRAGSARELAERAGTYGRTGGAEIRMIEYVEKLGSEFKIHLLADRISLDHRDIPLLCAGSDQYIPAGISKAGRSIGQSLCQRVGGETIDIEPLRHGLRTGAIAYAIRHWSKCARVREILVREDGKGEAILKRDDGRKFPSSYQRINQSAAVQERLSLSKR